MRLVKLVTMVIIMRLVKTGDTGNNETSKTGDTDNNEIGKTW